MEINKYPIDRNPLEIKSNPDAGLYIHIPYCKHKCSYCNFHFSTNLSTKKELFKSLIKEIESRSIEAAELNVNTLYFGGGTPSLLNEIELNSLLDTIRQNYKIKKEPEITLEANPDNLNTEYLKMLYQSGINRISIGVQSFFENDLSWMNRAHTVQQSYQSIEQTIQTGFTNFSIDLMYGLPQQSLENWNKNLQITLQFQVPHFSAYALTIEEKTALYHKVQKNTLALPNEISNVEQMDALYAFCSSHKYEPYEISNFAKSGFRSKHNSAYWNRSPYLGFGPAAHSFTGQTRRWNISNNNLYIQSIQNKLPYFETEYLSQKDQCNEYLMLQLRRTEGLDINYIKQNYNEYYSGILNQLDQQVKLGFVVQKDTIFQLSQNGRYISDYISSRLFV